MANNQLAQEAKFVLDQLIIAIQDLTMDEYMQPIQLLGNSSIGEHTRHIIELFQCLVNGYNKGIVNYDNRERNKRIQIEIDYAIECIAIIISSINNVDKSLVLATLHNNPTADSIATNYYRELLYNIEHCIHHQAIIKIGLMVLNKTNLDDNLGVAKSTIQYKQQCAQ